jgi:integrase/recombinase XerD
MAKHCPANERIKRDYLTYLKEAQHYSEASIDGVAAAIAGFEKYNAHKDFKRFHIQQAIGYKKKLADQTSSATGKPLSLATQRTTLNTLRTFFVWLAAQPGFKSRFTYADADYFSLSDKDNRAAQSHTPRPFPSLAQAQHAIRSMPFTTVIEQRDRALMAFTLMTGCRDRATVSLKLHHIDLANRRVSLDAREVATKNSKSFTTCFMPVGDDIRAIIEAWVAALTDDLQWGSRDPLFPASRIESDPVHGFRAIGLKREHWTTADAVRRIFRASFEGATLPYFHPHSFRHTLAQLGEKICQTPEEFKAWSQNLGHEHVMTTFNSYGTVSIDRQAEIIRTIGNPAQRDAEDLLQGLTNLIKGHAKM